MKKIILFLITAVLVFGISACGVQPKVILDNSDNSRFIDFYTEDGYVYIECELNVYSDSDTEARINATDIDDVKSGLLKNENLTGIDKADGDETFTLKKGEQKVTVLFRCEYGGVFLISEREIPRFISIEKE